tara:strand:- start:1378 stop:1752 length:375 start_codon:yes stop_codon:yes gene_type:complete
MKKNQLLIASNHRREANLLFKKSDRLKPVTIAIIGLALVAALVGKFALAGVSLSLGVVLLLLAEWWASEADHHWRASQRIIKRQRESNFQDIQDATRRRLEAGESSARGRRHRPIVEHAERVAK